MKIKEMRELLGLSRSNFSKEYEIPIRTLENWESGVNTPPPYVLRLLERVVMDDYQKIKDK